MSASNNIFRLHLSFIRLIVLACMLLAGLIIATSFSSQTAYAANSFKPAAGGVTAEAWNNCVEVSWSPVEGCDSYDVYRKEGKDAAAARPELNKYVHLATVDTGYDPTYASHGEPGFSDTFYADYYAKNGKTYSYIVISGDYGTQYSGNPSKSVWATPKNSLHKKPAAPNWFTLTSYSEGVALFGFEWNWDERGGQSDPLTGSYEPVNINGEDEVDHFNIYQNGRLVKQVQQKAYYPYDRYGETNYEWRTTLKCDAFNVPYTFWVTAVAPDGTESAPSKKDTDYREEDQSVSITKYNVFYTTEETYDDDYEHVIATYKGFDFQLESMGISYFNMWRKPVGTADSKYTKVNLTTTPEDKLMDTGVTQGKVYTYKIIGVASDGQESEPVIITVAAYEDEDDLEGSPGGYAMNLNFRTSDGEVAKLSWNAFMNGTYRLYRNGMLIKTWTVPNKRIEYTDDPGADGSYDYKVTWTSSKYPSVIVTTNTCRFVKNTSDPDPDSFDKAPGKPKLTGRVLGSDESNYLRLTWAPSKDGGAADGYIIYRTDGGVYNTHDWDCNLNSGDYGNPKRDEGESANGRYWCTKGGVNQHTMYDFKEDPYGGEDYHPESNPHRIWIIAYNEVGYSEPSNVLEYESSEDGLLPWDVDDTEPGTPENVRLWTEWTPDAHIQMGLTGKLHYAWSAPVNGGPVDHYDVTLSYSYFVNGTEYHESTTRTFNVGGSQAADMPIDEDNVGTTATVTVTAVNNKGQAAAAPVSRTITSIPALEVKTAGLHSTKLVWVQLLGAEVDSVNEYQIWRRTNACPWTKVQTVDPSSGPVQDPDYYPEVYTWTDTGLDDSTAYEYYVAAIDTDGNVHKSDTKAITTSVLDVAMDAPTNLTATNSNGDVILKWTPATTGGLPAYYRLEYQTTDKDPENDYSWSTKKLDESFGTSNCGVIRSWDSSSYHNNEVTSHMIEQYGGQELRLRIRSFPAQTVSQSASAPSDWILFTWPTASQIHHATNPPSPTTPTVTEGDGKITLKWNNVSEATYYQVVKTWGSNNGVAATFAADTCEWTDTDVVNGEKYTYELRPCSSYFYSYYNTQQWYHQWCYMHQVSAVPNGKTTDQKIAENITAFANELLESRPADLDTITDEYLARIIELNNNYAALTEYQKRLIGKDKCAEIEALISDVLYHDTQMQYAADSQLAEAIDYIDQLNHYPADISLDSEDFAAYEAAVQAARDAYDALPEDAKKLVNNLQQLKDAEAHIKQLRKDAADQALADDLSARMDALVPENISAETLTDELERYIQDLRLDYKAMTKAQKVRVRSGALDKLEAAEDALAIIHGAAHEHRLRYVEAVSPSCIEPGNLAYYKCSRCGRFFTDAAGRVAIAQEDILLSPDAGAHDWDDWTITTDADCTNGGIQQRVCRNDASHVETRSFEAYDHDWNAGTIGQETAIGSDGVERIFDMITFTCNRCGLERKARIEISGDGSCKDPTDHEWSEGQITKQATCIEEGEITSVCSKCKSAIKYDIQIDPRAHKWGEWTDTRPATCTESGTKTRECTLCHEMEAALTDPKGHKWDDGTVTREPLCGHTGVKSFTCETCGAEKTEIIPATEEHIWDAGTLMRRATSSSTGLRVHICEICGNDKEVIIPKAKVSLKLSATAYTWNNKVKTPSVTVTNNSAKMTVAQYKVTQPKGRKNVGTYTVSVALLGDFSGTYKASFKINPKGTAISKLIKAKKAITVKWKKQGSKMSKVRVTGYQVQLALNKKFTKGKKLVTIKGYAKTSRKITKLKAKKKYFVRIRTYTKTGGKTYYSPWSKTKTIRTK